jgi:hypothetical protein
MSRYKVTNLGSQTSQAELSKLKRVLMALQGIRGVKIIAGRSEFSIDYTGIEPHVNVLKEACTGVGFQLERKL